MVLAWLATAADAGSQVLSDEAQIRRARAESNRAIARHDVTGIVAFLADEYQVSASNGSFMRGRAEMGNAFAARFAEFGDATYVRTPESVVVSTSGQAAAETGRWVGSWTTPAGPFRTGGRYAAYWRKVAGKWLIHSELFVPLFCTGQGCG
jgi:ketosteroid isomerase-like protein